MPVTLPSAAPTLCVSEMSLSGLSKNFSEELSACQTWIFDFDSTLIRTESLEVMLERKLSGDPNRQSKMAEIEELTRQGMEGELSFKEGLERRLKIAAPRKDDIDEFVKEYIPSGFSEGIKELVEKLKARPDREIFILSGGFKELIEPFGK